MAEQRPRILYFKDFLPTSVCIGLSMFFAMVFQFNGGVFLPAATQMSSALGCIQEDVTMAEYASFIGMTIIFPILFRLKARFTTRSIFMTVCPVLIACNLITMHTENIFLMICVCFVSGFFRMWGTFECFSNIRLSITPSGNFSVFYPVIYIIVLESIQLSGLVTMHINDWANWQYMHWFVIGMLMIVWVCVMYLTRSVRLMKKMPLYGIDWIGLSLWTTMLFAIVFICIYGDYYDWLDSAQIRACIVIAVVALLVNINRMTSIRHPYIDPQVFKYKKFPVILFLFLMLCLFLATSSVLQNAFMMSILRYDTLNAISLNWCVFVGILAGAGVVFFRQAVLKKGYKLLISVGFTLIVVYQYYMYFLIYPDLNIESLYLPNFLKGIGHGILYIALTIYVAKHIPFKHFFQSLCVLSFIRTSIATPLGSAILNRWMKHLQLDNWALLSRDLDDLTESIPNSSLMQLYNEVNTQTMLTSLKELFGWVCIIGTVFLVIVLSYRIWRNRHLAALKMLHSLPVKKRYKPSSIHRISQQNQNL